MSALSPKTREQLATIKGHPLYSSNARAEDVRKECGNALRFALENGWLTKLQIAEEFARFGVVVLREIHPCLVRSVTRKILEKATMPNEAPLSHERKYGKVG